MQLETTFQKEINKIANGDGGINHRRAFRQTLRAVNAELSSPRVMDQYGACISKYGRVPVAICTAVTILSRQDRLYDTTVMWARKVLELWTNKYPNLDSLIIDDGLHSTRIEEYARELILLTTED